MLHLTKEQIRRLYQTCGDSIFDTTNLPLDEGCFIISESDVQHLVDWAADKDRRCSGFRPLVLDRAEQMLDEKND